MAAVASKNPFALLGDEDSSPAAPPTSTQKAAPAEPAAKPKSAPRPTPATRGARTARPRPSADGNLNQEGTQEAGNGAKRSEARGRGRGRGARGGRDRPDRHSQSGKTDSDKKVHQGWGGDDGPTELKDEAAATTDATADATAASAWDAPAANSWDAPADSTPADGADKPARKEREPREPEPEDNTLTLEQYLAQKEGLTVVPELETRQVEGDWKDVKPLEKSENDDYFVGKTKSTPKARAKETTKETLEVNFTAPQRAESGRGRGGRGGARGGRGGERGGERGERSERGERGGRGRGGQQGGRPSRQTGPSIDDESAFPALS